MDNNERRNRISQLRDSCNELKKLIEECPHSWSPRQYNPEKTFKEHFSGEYESHGSDPWPIMKSEPFLKPRWSETCNICGTTRYFDSSS